MTAPVLYIPDALGTADEDLAFFSTIAWSSRMRARQTASFGLPYDYSGQAYAACPMPPVIAAIAARAAAAAGHAFNNCLCNRYETGANAMGFHADSYAGLVAESQIAIASYGATRRLVFRSIDRRTGFEVVLEHGSLLLMTRATQDAWQHALPPSDSPGLRISATFRLVGGGEG